MASETEVVEIEESFVEFRFKKTGNSFYRIMMDEDETPFLSVSDLFSNWFEMSVECIPERKHCQGAMQPDNKIYWIDASQNQYGNSTEAKKHDLPPNTFIFKDDEAWLRFDIWDKWIPLNLVWDLDRYAINIQPYFLLIKDREKLRKKTRTKLLEEQNKRKQADHKPSIPPSELTQIEFRYSITGDTDFEHEHDANLSYDLGWDVYQGRLDASGNRSSQGSSGSDDLSYWRYRRLKNKHFYLFDLGETRYESNILTSSINIIDGIKFQKKEKKEGAGIFEFQDRTEPNSEIELYINGFLVSLLNSDNDGNYSIDKTPVSSGDRIELRFFFPDGAEDKRTIVIASDDSTILKKGNIDWTFLSGSINTNNFTSAFISYGIFDNFTVGGEVISLPQLSNGSNETIPTLKIAFRPFLDLGINVELSQNRGGLDYGGRINFTKFKSHIIQFDFLTLTDESFIKRSGVFSYESTDFLRLYHSWRIAPWTFSTRLMETNNQNSAKVNIDYSFDRDIDVGLILTSTNRYEPKDSTFSAIGNLTYSFSQSGNLEVSRNESELASGWNLRYRYIGNYAAPWNEKASDVPWRLIIGSNLPDDGVETFNIGLVWANTRNLTSNLQADKKGFTYQVTWRDSYTYRSKSVSSSEQWSIDRTDWNSHGAGTIEGYIMSPATDLDPEAPLEDVVIRASNKKTTTNAKGYFKLTGIPINERVKIKVDPNSLDASLAPVEDVIFAEFRTGTTLFINPKISWTAGFDGQLMTEAVIPPGAELKVKRSIDGKTVIVTPIESDGFFLAEGILPGEYYLEVDGVDNPPDKTTLTIPPGTDWVSDVQVLW